MMHFEAVAGTDRVRIRLRVVEAWVRGHPFFMIVLLPTLLASFYYLLIASDQYVTEARYLIRGKESSPSASILTGVLGVGAANTATLDAQGIRDFLESHDAVAELRKKLPLVEIFERPEADFISRLWGSGLGGGAPTAEQILKYYQNRVTVAFDTSSSISTLKVRAFRPDDAHEIAEQLLVLSEDLVNRYNARAQADTMRVARDELDRAEQRVIAAREALTAFRQREASVDPTRSATIALETIGKLEGSLVQAREELQEKSAYLRPENPQIGVLKNRVDALSHQVAAERARLTQGDQTLSQQIATYDRLMLEREFSDKQLAAATASLETARIEAERQQLFLVRVVEPNTAEEALYPRRLTTIVSIFVGLWVAYGIGWLIVAGVREHAA